ncbi:MAG: hypothetical protein DWP97_04095 [Calditrichaeota bacterium]|nr:MAG: hypothetical protein DWP97_04095 [Calditrichota bacterium]
MKKLTFLFLLCSFLLLIGCSDEGSAPTGSSGGTNPVDTIVNFATDVRPIIQSNGCLGGSCHGGSASNGGLNLGSAEYSEIISANGTNGAFVVANSSATSTFYIKVSQDTPSIGGSRMPLTGGALSAGQIEMIKDWIDQGALNN